MPNLHRPACNQLTDIPITFLGGCWNFSSSNAPLFKNVTQYPTYLSASLTSAIEPYGWANGGPDIPDCSPFSGYICGGTSSAANNNFPCGIPPNNVCLPSGSNNLSFAVGPYTNYYSASNLSASQCSCQPRVGFKNSYVFKQWHGRYSFNSFMWIDQQNNFDWCGACPWLSLNANPDTTKYLYMDVIANYSLDSSDSGTTTAGAENAIHVDRHSGNLIVDTFSSSSSDGTVDTAQLAVNLLNIGNGNITDLFTQYTSFVDGLGEPDSISGGGGSWTVVFNSHFLTAIIDSNAGTLSIQVNNPPSEVSTTTYSIGTTNYLYELEATAEPSVSFTETLNESVQGTLSVPYTSQEVYSDAVNLLAFLPLDRDDLLPWRSGSNVTQGPLINYDETLQTMTIPSLLSITSSTGNILGKPGPSNMDRVWIPNYQNWCLCNDPESGITCPFVQTYGSDNIMIGGGSATQMTDAMMSSNLIQGGFVSNNLFQGVPCSSEPSPGITPSATLWVGKAAEILIPKQSYNFARPCGADRFSWSTASYCVTSSTGTAIQFTNTGTPISFATGQYVWSCGISGQQDGCYQITNTGDYSIDLTTCIISSSLLPSSSLNCGTGLVYALQFQPLIPAICGQISITNATGSPVTCSMALPGYLVNGDLVQITNAKGLNINSFWTVSIIDPQTISLNGSNGITGTYGGSGLITTPGSANQYWNDTSTKGQYSIINWEWNNLRPVGEYLRLSQSAVGLIVEENCAGTGFCSANPIPTNHQYPTSCYPQGISNISSLTDCIEFNPCLPSVVFFSPNNETFGNSGSFVTAKNYWKVPSQILMDEEYGFTVQSVLQQSMLSPLAIIPPPCPCDLDNGKFDCNNFVWLSDDGSGESDSPSAMPPEKFFARYPVYEAISVLPSGSPPLPLGYFLSPDCLQPSETNASCSNGSVCYPPSNNALLLYTINQGNSCGAIVSSPYDTDWIRYLNEYGTVCASGRFSEEYKSNGVTCNNCGNEQVVPPP